MLKRAILGGIGATVVTVSGSLLVYAVMTLLDGPAAATPPNEPSDLAFVGFVAILTFIGAVAIFGTMEAVLARRRLNWKVFASVGAAVAFGLDATMQGTTWSGIDLAIALAAAALGALTGVGYYLFSDKARRPQPE